MSIEEIVYIGRDNTIELSLSVDNAVISHSSIMRYQVKIGTTLIDSAISPTLFDMSHNDKLILKLGQSGIVAGRYPALLYLFDSGNPNGLAWGGFLLLVK